MGLRRREYLLMNCQPGLLFRHCALTFDGGTIHVIATDDAGRRPYCACYILARFIDGGRPSLDRRTRPHAVGARGSNLETAVGGDGPNAALAAE